MKNQLVQATLFFLLKNDPAPQVLLGLKKRGLGAGKILGVGGKVETGERFLDAARREVFEEIGVTIPEAASRKVGILTFMFPHRPAWGQTVHVFTTAVWEGTPQESAEFKPLWFPFDKIPYHRMWDDGSYWLPKILAGETVRGEFIFNADNKTVQTVKFFDWNSPKSAGLSYNI